MANIMSQKNVKNKVHRNGFDLSCRNLFTAKPGQILPVFCKEVLPGDRFDIDLTAFTRTVPVQTAAYTRIQEYYDFYFVPTTLLWDKFDNFIVQTNNYSHAMSLVNGPDNLQTHPYMSMFEVARFISWLNHGEQGDMDGQSGINVDLFKDDFGFSRYKNALRLLDYLGYGDIDTYARVTDYESTVPSEYNDFMLNPFPLLAYQKICQDHFRYSQWETSRPYLCNLDFCFSQGQMKLPISDFMRIGGDGKYPTASFFDLQYCNYKKDLIMGLLPTAQFGDASIASPIVGSQTLNFTDVKANSGTNLNSGFRSTVVNNPDSTTYSLGSGLGVSVFALRFAEATQKWKEITQSGNLDYKEQIQKHWNVSVSDDQSYLSKWLGGTSGVISINEVVNQNLNDNEQAVLAGKGVGAINNRGTVKFSSNQYGYLMCVYHAVPVLDWLSYGADRFVFKTHAADYAIPEYDNIGMEEVPVAMVDIAHFQETGDPFGLLGYAPRYYDYKTSMDKVRGGFATSAYGDWVAPINNNLVLFESVDEKISSLDYRSFKVSPSCLNSIFLSQANSSVESDVFLISSFFDVKCVRNLSVNGLPY